ncbi:MAG: N-acetyltransferase family protein [Nocardioides sp.]
MAQRGPLDEVAVPEPRAGDQSSAEPDVEAASATDDAADPEAKPEPAPAPEAEAESEAEAEAEESEEVAPGEQIVVTAVDPAEVTQDLANRLAALDRSEMVASGRNLAVVNARALLTKLQTLSGALWVAGPPKSPVGWATLTTPAEGAVLHGTVSTRNRRKGVASRLMKDVLAYAGEQEYAAITCSTWTDSPSETFLRQQGFEARPQPHAVRCQDLYATAERRRRIGEDTAGYGASYELSTSEEELEQGATVYRVIATHLITGAEVGSAELSVAEGAPEFAVNGTVQVDPRHRGTRLGTLMALELIAFVQAKSKKVRTIQVSSPAADPYITTILDRIGFRVIGTQSDHRLRLR